MAREIVKKRVGPEGVEIDCEEDASKYVDIKETKKAKYERGRGQHYQRTNYNLCNDSKRRKYEEDPPEKITFKNPDNEDQEIPYTKDKGENHGIVKSVWLAAGRGEWYQRTRIHYCNTEDNERRKVREQRVENEDTGDHIMVERIERLTKDWGRGAAFQRKNVHPCNTEEQIKAMEGDCKPI